MHEQAAALRDSVHMLCILVDILKRTNYQNASQLQLRLDEWAARTYDVPLRMRVTSTFL